MRDKNVCTTGILFAGTREFENMVLRRGEYIYRLKKYV
jgi:hypothetical protein